MIENSILSWEVVLLNIIIITFFVVIILRINTKEKKIESFDNNLKKDRNIAINALITSLRMPVVLLNENGSFYMSNQSFRDLYDDIKMSSYLYDNSEIQSFILGGLQNKRIEKEIGDKTFYVDLTRITNVKFNKIMITYNDISLIKDVYAKQEIFINDVSHELKTPITAIVGLSELLVLDKVNEKSDVNKIIKTINKEALRIKVLINSLTNSLHSKVNYRSIDFDEIFDDLRLIYQNKSDKVELRFANYVDNEVISDQAILQQIIINLVDNALKFTNEGYIKVSSYLSEDKVKISVVDTGQGIAQKDLDLIFERFYRSDYSRSKKTGGHGLGLSICSELAKKISGKLEVSSLINQGTTFTLSIPRKK